jgi:hypothetical protein
MVAILKALTKAFANIQEDTFFLGIAGLGRGRFCQSFLNTSDAALTKPAPTDALTYLSTSTSHRNFLHVELFFLLS